MAGSRIPLECRCRGWKRASSHPPHPRPRPCHEDSGRVKLVMAALRDFTLLQPRARLDSAFYDRLRANARSAQMRDQFTIPPFQGRGFIVRKGQSFRIVQVEGVQIGDVAFWNVDHPAESYSLARTWAIEGWVT